MSLHSYQESQKLMLEDYPFSSLIMAAIRKADSVNVAILENAFPEIHAEFKHRYWSGGGLLSGEKATTLF